MAASTPQIDFTRIRFPTDQVTIASLREKFPRTMEVGRPDFGEIAGTMASERRLAQLAFDAVLGIDHDQDDSLLGNRRELIAMLADEYKNLGLSSGKKHTEELVSPFEASAAAQAQSFLGRTP